MGLVILILFAALGIWVVLGSPTTLQNWRRTLRPGGEKTGAGGPRSLAAHGAVEGRPTEVRGVGALRNWIGYSIEVATVPPGWYLCYVKPIGGGEQHEEPYLLPRPAAWREGRRYAGGNAPGHIEQHHRLDLGSAMLRKPARDGGSWPAVITGEELKVLAEKGFTITHGSGPFRTTEEAEDALVDLWTND
jgi:hypothetical protein